MRRILPCLPMLLVLLAGCGQSSAPVEPAAQATELRDAVQAPLDKARAVEQTLQEDADNTRKAVEDAGG